MLKSLKRLIFINKYSNPSFSLMAQVLHLLPCEIWVISTEMTSMSRLSVNWSLQTQILNDCSWSQVEVSSHNTDQVLISVSFSHCSVTVNEHAQWL